MGGAIGVLGIVEREVDDRPVAGAPSARREEDAADAAADYQDTWMGQPVKRLDACGRVFEPDRRVRVFMSPSSAALLRAVSRVDGHVASEPPDEAAGLAAAPARPGARVCTVCMLSGAAEDVPFDVGEHAARFKQRVAGRLGDGCSPGRLRLVGHDGVELKAQSGLPGP